MKIVTKKDIVIPAGTVLHDGPSKTVYHSGHNEATIEVGPDATMTLTVPREFGLPAFDEIFTELKE